MNKEMGLVFHLHQRHGLALENESPFHNYVGLGTDSTLYTMYIDVNGPDETCTHSGV